MLKYEYDISGSLFRGLIDHGTNAVRLGTQRVTERLATSRRVGNRERGLQSQQRETKKERDAWGSFTKDEEVSQG